MNRFVIHHIPTIQFSLRDAAALLPLLFFLANEIRLIYGTAVPYYVMLFAAAAAGYCELLCRIRSAALRRAALFGFLYMLTVVCSSALIGNTEPSNLLTTAALFGVLFLMISAEWSVKQAAAVYYLSFILLAVKVFGKAEQILQISSSNFVSVLILLAAALYYIPVEREYHTIRGIDLVPAALAFLLAVRAGGRGGILSLGLFLAAILFLNVGSLTSRNTKRVGIAVVLFLCLSALLFLTEPGRNIVNTVTHLGKWGTKGTDNSDRLKIWMAYLNKSRESFLYFFFGAPLEEIAEIVRFEGNCHNSFLQLHAYNGLLMLLVTVIFTVRTAWIFLKRKQFILLSLLITVIIRGMTDKFIFGQYGLPIYLYLILYPSSQMNRSLSVSPNADDRQQEATH